MRKALAILVCLAMVPVVSADYSFAPFTLAPVGNLPGSGGNDGALAQQLDVSGVPAGTYTEFYVTCWWNNQTGVAYSTEANLFFLEAADFITPGFIYQNGTTANNGQNSTADIQLIWSGYFTNPYEGGDPLAFGAAQSYNNSTADWTDIEITLIQGVTPPPTVDMNTFGSTFDTELGLFDNDGFLLAQNDDAGGLQSQILYALPDGIYHLAIGKYNTTFADGFNVTVNTTPGGTYFLNIDGEQVLTGEYMGEAVWYTFIVPEPATALLIALGGIALIRRR